VADGKVYIGSDDRKVYCLNADTGAWIWDYTADGSVSSSPAVADGKVYVGSYDRKVYCLGTSLGKRVSQLESSLTDALERIDDLEAENSAQADDLADLDARLSDVETLLGEGFSLSLSAGWNLVSFPLVSHDTSFATIFSGVPFYQVLTWDGTMYTSPGVAEAGVGYWVLVLEETVITV
jgi:hypothetical protein